MDNRIFKNLSGKILIASPYALYGNIFYKSLIYVLLHSNDGAIGLVLNHMINEFPLSVLLKTFEQNENIGSVKLPVHLGGPMELERIFLLHSDDYNKNLLLKFPNNLAISSNTEILKDISEGTGPKNSLFMLGYTGWKAGELEMELAHNLWIISDCNTGLIFDAEQDSKWDTALKRLGITNNLYTSIAGHA